jgi:hypothetical protein
LVDELHFPAVFKYFDPLLVWHIRGTSGEATVVRKYTSFGIKSGIGIYAKKRGRCTKLSWAIDAGD